ncbi:MAG: aminopeptidase P family protein, partial [Planctomycetota bacterium]
MFSLEKIQEKLKEFGFDGWLLYDFRFCNPLARRVLGLSEKLFLSRRWFYFIPASGDPVKINHKIEPAALASYPGISNIYLRWQELESSLKTVLAGKKRIAMEYSPNNAIPYLSRVDAGTIEFIKTLGVDVVSSGD